MGLKKWIVVTGIVSSLQVNLVTVDLKFARIQRPGRNVSVPSKDIC